MSKTLLIWYEVNLFFFSFADEIFVKISKTLYRIESFMYRTIYLTVSEIRGGRIVENC